MSSRMPKGKHSNPAKKIGRPALPVEQAFNILRKMMTKSGGFAPSVEEYRAALNVHSKRTALRYLRRLHEHGFIKRRKGRHGLLLARLEPGDHTLLRRLKKAEEIRIGDWCCDPRGDPVRVTVDPEHPNDRVVISEHHHPHYRIDFGLVSEPPEV